MDDLKTETRLIQKNRLCWLLALVGAFITGAIYYFLTPNFAFVIYLTILAVFAFFYSIFCELVTKTTWTFLWRGGFVLPSGLIFAYFLNLLSPKPWFMLTNAVYPFDGTYLFGVAFLSLLVSFICCFTTIALTRFIVGYESLVSNLPVRSYSIEGKCNDIFILMSDFLKSLDIQPNILVGKNSNKIMTFFMGSNEYYLFTEQVSDACVQVDFVPVNMERDTLIEVNQEELEDFLVYLQAFLNEKKRVKPVSWTAKFNSEIADSSEKTVLKRITTQIRLTQMFEIRGLATQRIITLLDNNKKGIVLFIIGTVIVQIIIKYI